MKYDFDEIIDRRGTDSVKWDLVECDLPMWVADMDFKAPPEVINALKNRIEHGVFGYTFVPDAWYESYINWWRDVHDFKMEKDWLLFSETILAAISSVIANMTLPGEKVILQTPEYNHFFYSINNNNRKVIENPLVFENGAYKMDFEDLESKMADPDARMLIISNPHNPTGNVWSKDDLIKIGDMAKKHNVIVVSDEIHCDIIRPGMGYVPFASASENCRKMSISCISPTKAFNIAGIKTAAVLVPDDALRKKTQAAIEAAEAGGPNTLSCTAAMTAYNEGKEWLRQMNEYVFDNRDLAEQYIKEEIPQLSVIKSDSTYLMWIDISRISDKSSEFTSCMRKDTGLFVSPGNLYGERDGRFIRMNIACPRKLLIKGLELLKRKADEIVNK